MSDTEKSLNQDSDRSIDATDTTTPYDAQQLIEEIEIGDEKAPKVNVEADYKRSKELSVADSDRSNQTMETLGNSSDRTTAGNPDAFREMAKEVTPTPDE